MTPDLTALSSAFSALQHLASVPGGRLSLARDGSPCMSTTHHIVIIYSQQSSVFHPVESWVDNMGEAESRNFPTD